MSGVVVYVCVPYKKWYWNDRERSKRTTKLIPTIRTNAVKHMGVASIERAHPHQLRVRIFKGAFTLHELHKSRAMHCKLWNTDSDSSFVTFIILYSTPQHTVTRKQRSKLIDTADKVTAAGVASGRLKWAINDVHSVRRLFHTHSQSTHHWTSVSLSVSHSWYSLSVVCCFVNSLNLWSRMSSGPPLKRLKQTKLLFGCNNKNSSQGQHSPTLGARRRYCTRYHTHVGLLQNTEKRQTYFV